MHFNRLQQTELKPAKRTTNQQVRIAKKEISVGDKKRNANLKREREREREIKSRTVQNIQSVRKCRQKF